MIPVLEFMKDGKSISIYPFSLWVYRKGTIEVNFQYLKNYAPFNLVEKREELFKKLNTIPGVSIPLEKIEKRPSFQIDQLKDRIQLDRFLKIIEWVLEEL